jgi:uncharacterized membrane protein
MRAGAERPHSGGMTLTDHRPADPRPATPAQLAWLGREVAGWRTDGLVTDEQATALLGRYHEVRRLDLSRLALGLGATFAGVGLIWLVAANLDALPPLGRFTAVAALWVATTVGAELLARRTRTRRSPVVGAARGLAALAYGAVVFQAAQSMQVPAYEPRLLGIWAAGALLHAYAVRGIAPLVIGVATGVGWVAWDLVDSDPSALGAVLALAAVAGTGLAAGRLHGRTSFARVWRLAGTLGALAGLFVAAVPGVDTGDLELTTALALGLVAAATLTVLAARGAAMRDLAELAVAPAVVLIGWVLLAWNPSTALADVGPEEWLHSGASVAAYVLVAAALAAVGVVRDDAAVTWLAVAGLAVFTTFQAFAVFAPIVEGAFLFLALGAVFAATGWLADRARREMVDALEGEQS